MSRYPSLEFAGIVSTRANEAWSDGSFLESVTPTTKALLTYWFDPDHCELREVNFHEGQRQAILNTIYIHEVLKKYRIYDAYEALAPQLLLAKGFGFEQLSDDTFNHPKYCVKMATGTGKTWVLQALLTWQYLNAKHEEGHYSKNFLIVAPGLIVYERLLDAFLGKVNETTGERDFEKSDIYSGRKLFLPVEYREEVFGFLQSSVANKQEIGRKVTGDGLIAITNYHLLSGAEEEVTEENELVHVEKPVDVTEVLDAVLPVRPSASAGNSLDVLDSGLDGKKELEYLRSLKNLVVFNDEAHHIHSVSKAGEVFEVEWLKALRYISKDKGKDFIQVDFSATPYNQKSKDTKIYFPHIICDFELKRAIQQGLVKTLVLDERKEFATEELEFRAVRDERGKPIELSEGQRLMLRAGLAKLKMLETHFSDVAADHNKYPKMMITCEETEVVGMVTQFLRDEGLDADDILEIHSNKKGEVGTEEWEKLKAKLFSLDTRQKPRVVVSVLMLKEGFDVNNICVVVPLRSTTSGILLEQTIGRGLRLMWRDPEFDDIKRENRHRILVDKISPTNYFDILSIVEHPAFRQFYKDLVDEGLVGIDDGDIEDPTGGGVTGDIISVGLKPNYREYDFGFPIVVHESDTIMQMPEMDAKNLRPFIHFRFEQLQKLIPKNEQFISQEITKGARFGDYEVSSGVFKSTSYNDYVARLVSRVSDKMRANVESVSKFKRGGNDMPGMQVNMAQLAGLVDDYIRHYLFGTDIDPNENDNWKVLRIQQVIDHIVAQVSGLVEQIHDSAQVVGTTDVLMPHISDVEKLVMRESKSTETAKTPYERTPFPSNKGEFERAFIEYADNDPSVAAFVKISETKHTFVQFRYIREDGLGANYSPDFLVRCGDTHYIVETKGQDQLSHINVQRKQIAAMKWVQKINSLPPEKREGKTWEYVLLGETIFYDWSHKRADLVDILEYAKLKANDVLHTGRLL